MIRTSRKLPLLAGFSLLGIISVSQPLTPARAATATTTFAVTATVQATCLISATPLPFGTYNGTQTDSSSTITATCSNTTPYSIGLSAGGALGASVTARKMTGSSGALLAYSLYNDTAHSANWGDTANNGAVAGAGTGNAQAITVYGRIAAGQFVAAGAYTDTITATITF